MRTSLLLSTSLFFLGGCSVSSLDDDVTPSVASAAVELSSSPDTFADVRVELRLEGGPRANRTVVLGGVELREPPNPTGAQKTLANLDLKFPSTFSPHIGEDEVKTVTLENVGTTNATLQAFCGTDVSVFIKLAYEGDSSTAMFAQKTLRPTCVAR